MNFLQRVINFRKRVKLKRAADLALTRMVQIENFFSHHCIMRDYDRTAIFYKCPFCDSTKITVSYDELEQRSLQNDKVICPTCEKGFFEKKLLQPYFNNRKIYYEWVNSPLNPAYEKSVKTIK